MNILLLATALALPFAETTVEVEKDNPFAEFAAKELNEIVKTASGREFDVKEKVESKSEKGRKSIFIYRDDNYADEESAVFEKDGNLYLVGGGEAGCVWAVYDFVEDNLGYHWYFSRPDGEVIDKSDEVVFKGNDTRKKPVFKGFRKIYTNIGKGIDKFPLRNRDTSRLERYIKGWKYKYTWRTPGHGFLLYLPWNECMKGWGDIAPEEVKHSYFEAHPEWYSLGKDGKRHPDMQLCLSNPATRDALYTQLHVWMRHRGEKGVFMIGSNDNHNDRYCWCEDCIALEKKYGCVGGPLWDTILDLCARLKRDGHNDTYITSLVYKGPGQTEKAPIGIEKFPDNFIADLAFLNSDRTIREYPTQKNIGGEKEFNKWENAQKWAKLCDNKSYWYYGSCHPTQVYKRMHKEILELRELGVENAGACGAGGGFAFSDMTYSLFLQMLYNPDRDWRAIVTDMMSRKFGKAAPLMLQYSDELYDSIVKNGYPGTEILLSYGSPIAGSSFIKGEEIVRWQKLFDEAGKLVADDPSAAKFVRYARIELDVWNVMFAKKVRAAVPDYQFDVAALDARARTAEKAMLDEYGLDSDKKGAASGALNAFANFATLKTDALPAELANENPDNVTLFLPGKRGKRKCGPQGLDFYWSCEADEKAACGFASFGQCTDTLDYSKGVYVEVYNDSDRRWYLNHWIKTSELVEGEYTLAKVGTSKIGSSVHVVIGSDWASPLNTTQLSRLYDPTYENRQYEIWVSLKAEGPKFFPGSEKKNSLAWDRIYTIDRGVPEGK